MSPQLPLYFPGMNPLGVEHREIIFYSYLIVLLLLLFHFIVIVVVINYWEESGGDWGGRGGREEGAGRRTCLRISARGTAQPGSPPFEGLSVGFPYKQFRLTPLLHLYQIWQQFRQ